MLSFRTFWLQQECGFKLVFGIFGIFKAEINLAQQQPGGELSRGKFEAGFKSIAGPSEVTRLLAGLTFVKSGSRVIGSGLSGQFQMFGGADIFSGVKLEFSQLS